MHELRLGVQFLTSQIVLRDWQALASQHVIDTGTPESSAASASFSSFSDFDARSYNLVTCGRTS